MTTEQLTAPFPYFGGKRHIAPLVWELFGDVGAYVEPFAGSAAVLLGRPKFIGKRREILNDMDGWITNLWRSIRDRPDEVLKFTAGPMMELDNHARLAWLQANHTPDFVSWLEGDPEHCDPKAAGWWLTATIGSIGGGTRRGPWVTNGDRLLKSSDPRAGITRAIPHIAQGSAGLSKIDEVFPGLTARMKHVVITCGDWKRPLSKTLRHYSNVGVLLDPPYESRSRTEDGHTLYANDDHEVSALVREWCAAAPDWRIVLCGYDDEHDELVARRGWRKMTPPKAVSSGYNVTDLNSQRDRLWVSPACLDLDSQQAFDFDALLSTQSTVSEADRG